MLGVADPQVRKSNKNSFLRELDVWGNICTQREYNETINTAHMLVFQECQKLLGLVSHEDSHPGSVTESAFSSQRLAETSDTAVCILYQLVLFSFKVMNTLFP